MADRSSKLGMIIVTSVAVVLGAALAVVFLWWMPKQDREDARAQVAEWERLWSTSRACLLGDPALSADPADALALRQLTTGAVHSGTSCTQGVGKLMRPAGAASPLDEVERAWAAVEAAIPALGEAYVMWVSAEHDERDRPLTDLGVAISSLDAAQDELRRAAGMSALSRKGSVTLTRLDAPVPVVVDGRAITTERAEIMAGAITTQRFDEGATVEVIATGPTTGRTMSHGVAQVLGMPDGSWTAAAVPATVLDPAADPELGPAVTYHETGAPPDQVVVVVPAGRHLVPIAALGAGDERSIVLEQVPAEPLTGDALALARSTDRGRSWTLAEAGGFGFFATGELGELRLDVANATVDLAYRTYGGSRLIHLDATRPFEVAILPTTTDDFRWLPEACRKGASLWWASGDGVGLLDGAELTMVSPPTGDRVIDCTADAALVEESTTPVVYHRCDHKGCLEAMRGGAYTFGRAAMLDDGRVVYAASRGRLLALWTEGTAEARFYKLPEPRVLHAVVVWGGVPHALLHDPEDDSHALASVALE